MKKLDIEQSVEKIADLHTRLIPEEEKTLTMCSDMGTYKIYASTYTKPKDLELKHIFYDVADIIV